MHRKRFLVGLVAVMVSCAAAGAQVQNGDKMKLLGRDYTVVITPRTGTFKNGATVNPQKPGGDVTADTLKANLAFAPGTQADGSGDRLFVVAATQGATGVTSDGFYMLQGTDPRGVFAPEFSNAHVFFRGDLQVHGRFQSLAYINDTDTGPAKDRNLIGYTFTDANYYRWYDLSDLLALPLTGRTDQDAFRLMDVYSVIQTAITEAPAGSDPPRDESTDDPNLTAAGWAGVAVAPNGTLLAIGPANGDWEISAIDAAGGTKFYPVKTALANVLPAAQVEKIDVTQNLHALARLRGDEYLILAATGDPNWDEAAISGGTLYHVRITLPADLTKEAPDSIKVELLSDPVDVPALNLGRGDSKHLFGLAVGRERNGANTLYFADYAGNLFTLVP
jgi:hypothetical protein